MSYPPKHFITNEKAKRHAEILSNRISKRFRHLFRKFKRQGIDCFRLYDWDIPEVRAVVDWYAGHIVIAEYERLQTSQRWLPEMAQAVAEALQVSMDKVHMKRRHTKTGGGPRYKRLAYQNKRLEVRERNLRFWVNLDDFLDTGLYNDHRDTRDMIVKLASGKDFLNLYGYTASFSCAAAFGGAKATVTVDRSVTNINWAKDNLRLNGFSGREHTLVQSDCMKYLTLANKDNRRFTLAFVDPPSFFRDRGTGESFDINADQAKLLQAVLGVMASGGSVFFSTNHQRFQPEFDGLDIKDIFELTPKTIPEDYRNRGIHRCWRITVK